MLARLMYPRMKYAIASLAVLTLFLGLTATAAAGPGFITPEPVLWLDASLGVTVGDETNPFIWADQSGNGHDASQASFHNQPTQVMSPRLGKPVIRFDAEYSDDFDDWLEIPETVDNHFDIGEEPDKGFTAFIMYKGNDIDVQRYLLGKGWVNDYSMWNRPGGGHFFHTGNGQVGDDFTPPADVFQVHTYDHLNRGDEWGDDVGAGPVPGADGFTDGADANFWLNGEHIYLQQLGNLNPNSPGKYPANDGPLYIGRHPYSFLPTGYNAWGDMAELIIFDTKLSTEDRETVESYLTAKYPAVPSIPGDTNYDNVVDAVDAAVVAGNWQLTGLTGRWADGDFDDDGDVDDIDATIMATNWTGSGASASVPEPQSLLLVALGAVCLGIMRRRNS